jgi:hypothetical protein
MRASLRNSLELFEQLEGAEEKVAEQFRGHELAPYVMSIPGIGIGIAAVILAYIGAILDPQFRLTVCFRADLSLQAFRLGREKGAVTKGRAD